MTYALESERLSKRVVIVPDANALVEVKTSWIEYSWGNVSRSTAFSRIKALYLHREIRIQMSDVLYLCEFFPVYFIDDRKKMVGKLVRIA